ncbi:hypothetical protein [Burkholderia sp. 9120]|uniref:hypothetical protein n=1 Tax=Burkholderia sp. 9120 TaxID=1500897 RepID=UPI00055945DF|nr:hypothetical protein [Burkholderia sp. 9120]
MPKLNLPFSTEPPLRDTIRVRSIVNYDPTIPRATTPMMVGQYVVARSPLHGSAHTLYKVMDGPTVVRTFISIPDADDCRMAIVKHRLKAADTLAEKTIARAKSSPLVMRHKEVA